MADEPTKSEVIEVDFKDPKPTITKRETKGYCQHPRVEVDCTAQRLYCRACELELSPIKFVIRLATDWDRYYWSAKQSQVEADRLRIDITDLKRERKNLKAQVARLKRNPLTATVKLLRDARAVLIWAMEERGQCACDRLGGGVCPSHKLLAQFDAEIAKSEPAGDGEDGG
jgi:hypothetical protein